MTQEAAARQIERQGVDPMSALVLTRAVRIGIEAGSVVRLGDGRLVTTLF